MAISKAAAEKAEMDELGPLTTKWEQKLDDALSRGARTYGTKDVPKKVVNELLKLYRAQGWKVQHVTDQRDGAFLQFS
jgi:hypothetical protein